MSTLPACMFGVCVCVCVCSVGLLRDTCCKPLAPHHASGLVEFAYARVCARVHRPRDFYHTCYCLSGLSVAQRTRSGAVGTVWGDKGNLLVRPRRPLPAAVGTVHASNHIACHVSTGTTGRSVQSKAQARADGSCLLHEASVLA